VPVALIIHPRDLNLIFVCFTGKYLPPRPPIFLSHIFHRCHNSCQSGEWRMTIGCHDKLLSGMQKERSTCRVYELTLPGGAPGPEWAPGPVSHTSFTIVLPSR